MQGNAKRVGNPGKSPDYAVYPGLRKWMLDNHLCTADIHRIMYPGKRGWHRTRDRLSGDTKLCVPDINRIIQVSGKSYEYLFMMSEQEVEEKDKDEV